MSQQIWIVTPPLVKLLCGVANAVYTQGFYSTRLDSVLWDATLTKFIADYIDEKLHCVLYKEGQFKWEIYSPARYSIYKMIGVTSRNSVPFARINEAACLGCEWLNNNDKDLGIIKRRFIGLVDKVFFIVPFKQVLFSFSVLICRREPPRSRVKQTKYFFSLFSHN